MNLSYKVLLRPAYEAYAASAWFSSSLVMAAIGVTSTVPSSAFASMSAGSLAMALHRSWQTKKIWDYKISLAGKPFSYLDGSLVVEYNKSNPDYMWLGYGFDWQPSHSQMAYDMLKEDREDIYPPIWYLKAFGVHHDPRDQKGVAWIHGLEPDEEVLRTTWDANEGHTSLWGTTGAGKTRMYEVMLIQMAARGDAIIVVDPKGDKDLEQLCKDVATFIGKPEKFIKFHPAFPSTSIRLDPMKNFNRGTEIASRISSLTSSESGKDTFAAVTWDAINSIGAAERYLGVRTQLKSALKRLSSGTEKLLEEVLRKYMNEYAQGWQALTGELVKQAQTGKLKTNMQTATAELIAAATYYKREVQGLHNNKDADVVDNLLRVAEYPRDWHSKMVATVIPLLTMLNSEELGKMLSPDYDDIDDARPIFDTQKIIEGRYICYIGLDSLSDVEVGSAIASIIFSALASDAGFIYNYGDKNKRIKVQLLIDEASEVVNQPLIQILNKGRGAGISVTMAAQNYADYVNRMGTEPKARMLLGNCNNMICLRIVDGQTQDFVVDKIGETWIKTTGKSHGSGNRTEDHGLQFSGNISESISTQKVDTIPKDLLGKLPDLQYFALLAGGRLIKGRIPKVELTA